MLKVETFEQTETELGECSPDVEAEALDLIERLGLTGQDRLRAKPEDGGHRGIYRQITAEERAVYGILCPTHEPLTDYQGGPVPVRVMKAAERAAPHFSDMEVWWAGEAVNPDPVLIGVREHPEHSWKKTRYMIARWGEELAPFGELREKAKQAYRARLESVARQMAKGWEAVAETVDALAEQRVVGETPDLPYRPNLP